MISNFNNWKIDSVYHLSGWETYEFPDIYFTKSKGKNPNKKAIYLDNSLIAYSNYADTNKANFNNYLFTEIPDSISILYKNTSLALKRAFVKVYFFNKNSLKLSDTQVVFLPTSLNFTTKTFKFKKNNTTIGDDRVLFLELGTDIEGGNTFYQEDSTYSLAIDEIKCIYNPNASVKKQWQNADFENWTSEPFPNFILENNMNDIADINPIYPLNINEIKNLAFYRDFNNDNNSYCARINNTLSTIINLNTKNYDYLEFDLKIENANQNAYFKLYFTAQGTGNDDIDTSIYTNTNGWEHFKIPFQSRTGSSTDFFNIELKKLFTSQATANDRQNLKLLIDNLELTKNATSLIHLKDHNPSIYYNNSIIYINNLKIDNLKVFDINGKLVLTQNQLTSNLNINHLKNGIYMIQINNSSDILKINHTLEY